MRGLFYALAALAVIGLAYWAYSENYKTQDALREAASLSREIGNSRETLAVLEAEWAYLNRPERLRDLASLNFEQLQLLEISSDQLGSVDSIPYPPHDIFSEITGGIDVRGLLTLAKDGEQFP